MRAPLLFLSRTPPPITWNKQGVGVSPEGSGLYCGVRRVLRFLCLVRCPTDVFCDLNSAVSCSKILPRSLPAQSFRMCTTGMLATPQMVTPMPGQLTAHRADENSACRGPSFPLPNPAPINPITLWDPRARALQMPHGSRTTFAICDVCLA